MCYKFDLWLLFILSLFVLFCHGRVRNLTRPKLTPPPGGGSFGVWFMICYYKISWSFMNSHNFVIFRYFFGKKAPAAKYIWAFYYEISWFFMNSHLFMIFHYLLGKKAPAAKYIWVFYYEISCLFICSLSLGKKAPAA